MRPNKYNSRPRFEQDVSPVSPRFSFMDRGLLRQDVLIKEGIKNKRIIKYPLENAHQRQLRDSLNAKGAVLGHQIDSEHNYEAFMVPLSARPLTHEAQGEDSTSAYAYNDSQLFRDLGTLLGNLAYEASGTPLMLEGPIGRHIAIVEFTRKSEHKTLLVPGFELSVKSVPTYEEVLHSYGSRLLDEFGEQFEHHADDFLQGFDKARS